MSASSAAPISSALVAAMSRQMSARARRQPRRVGKAASRERQPLEPDGVAHHLHERARGQLRQMAEEREEPIVLVDTRDSRNRSERRHERGELVDAFPVRVEKA